MAAAGLVITLFVYLAAILCFRCASCVGGGSDDY